MTVKQNAEMAALAVWLAHRVLDGELLRSGSSRRRQTQLVTWWAKKYNLPRGKLAVRVMDTLTVMRRSGGAR